MKLNPSTVVKYCRIIAAVCLLKLCLSQEPSVLFKYTGYLICIAVAGIDPKILRQWQGDKESGVKLWRYAAYCVCLILTYTVAVSYVLPAAKNDFDITPTFAVSAVILSPVFEELLFRASFIGRSKNLTACIIFSAIFGAFHGADFLQAFLMGLVLSYFYISSGSIAVPIICHMANNLLAIICMRADLRIPVAVVALLLAIVIYRRRNEEKIL